MTMLNEDAELDGGDGVSVAGSVLSYAPSLHPSMAGSAVSKACSENTIGAGDETGYWDFTHRSVEVNDLGHTCRECKKPFRALGEPLTERRGARTSMRYHAECFSGFADPRSQAGSSHAVGHLAGTQFVAAPTFKAGNKMRAGSHFAAGASDKGPTKLIMGSNDFGARSSKGQGMTPLLEQDDFPPVASDPSPSGSGLTMAALAEHTRRIEEEEREDKP
jgi:hypothetical protein